MNQKSSVRSAALALSAALACVSAPAGASAGADAEFVGTVIAVSAAVVRDAREHGPSLADPGRVRAAAEAPAPQAAGGTILHDKTTPVSVELNARTVKCSAADYSEPMLKVLVPGLAELTVLNHRNAREGAPCVAAGRCGAVGPQDILRAGEGAERVPIRVILRKDAELEGGVCHVSLVETVTAVIRGVPFYHERRQAVADRNPADCR